MNKEQKAQVLKKIYNEAKKTLLESVSNRQKALYQYTKYLQTVERTVQVYCPDFNIERDLELVSRGLDDDILRYVTRLEHKQQIEQFKFYDSIEKGL